ncbi:RNA cytidine acetyltransferase-like isoform X2 [Gigantopelta aegis]|nr:RNA cytidine acetyltransferase-like isoform X2 [Gigantopelta aegis]
MTMDVHSRFRTEAHQDVIGRFNERFILSLTSCRSCMVLDDQLNILPLSTHTLNIEPIPAKSMEDAVSPREEELRELKSSLKDVQPVGAIVDCCKTVDQAKAVLRFVEGISEKTLRSTVVLTAARGRGKSAALGLSMATAVAFGYSNIFVTAPSPENLKTLFEFIFKGLDALEYQEHLDYEIIQSTNPDFNKAVVRVNVFREHRQTIQYIHPSDSHKLGQAELVCIDEAAAIPLPLVKNLLGPYLVFMSSTINGYEGTGRSLSLKLIQQLRKQSATYGGVNTEVKKAENMVVTKKDAPSSSGRILHEGVLNESIRYADGDPVESWLYGLLCLDATNIPRILSGCPIPETCDLYYVNRDTLFSYHKASEAFLHRIMGLCVASHYKNTPNDLQMLSDAPAFHIFVLLGPVQESQNSLPEVLCVVQVSLEGEISKQSIMSSLSRGQRASGDLIPWTVSQQFQDHDFPGLSGARIVRIATHPDYQGMGYGSRALQLLQHYYEGKVPSLQETPDDVDDHQITSLTDSDVNLLKETPTPRKNLPPLLLKLSERRAEKLDYLGVSYGLTSNLLRFWKKAGFVPVYVRQTQNDLTGEHSSIMLKVLNSDQSTSESWLSAFWKDFRRRLVSLLSYQFRSFSPSFALNLLVQKQFDKNETFPLTHSELSMHFTKYDLKRLELYSRNMVDYHLIIDLLPAIARLYFVKKIDVHLSAVQLGLLLGLGLQHKSVDDLEKELDLPVSQLLALFNRIIRKIVQYFNQIVEKNVELTMVEEKQITMMPVVQNMEEELEEAAAEIKAEHKKKAAILVSTDLSQYAIHGSEKDWDKALTVPQKQGLVSIKGKPEKRKEQTFTEEPPQTWKKQKKFKKKS